MATMINCQPVRHGMSTFLISTQTVEQYNPDNEGFHDSYFKPKGGHDFIIHTNGRVWEAVVFVTMMLRQDDDLNDPPIDFTKTPQYYYEIVHDWDEVALDYKTEREEWDEDFNDRIVVVIDEPRHPHVSEEDVAAVHAYWTVKGLKWRLDGLPEQYDEYRKG